MTRPGMPNAFQQTETAKTWKVALKAIDDFKETQANAVATLFLKEFSGILEPFKFRSDRQFRIDWGMGSLTLEVWDKGKRIGCWFSDGTSTQNSKVRDIHWARPNPLHIALKKILEILRDMDTVEEEIILSALHGKFIKVNHL